jgi:hypothetical protein
MKLGDIMKLFRRTVSHVPVGQDTSFVLLRLPVHLPFFSPQEARKKSFYCHLCNVAFLVGLQVIADKIC